MDEKTAQTLSNDNIQDSNDDTLMHYGIKGQKWYVRRYQNADGTLTSRGKKRYAKEMEKLKAEEKVLKNKQRTAAKIEKLNAKKQEIEEAKKALSGKGKKSDEINETPNKKVVKRTRHISELSDEELIQKIDRLVLENRYKELISKPVKDVKKEPVTKKGDGIVKKALKTAGSTIATNVAKKAAEKIVDKMFSMDNSKGKNENKSSTKSETPKAKVVKNDSYSERTKNSDRHSNVIDVDFRDVPVNDSTVSSYASSGSEYVRRYLLE